MATVREFSKAAFFLPNGKYYDRGKARTFKRAIQAIPKYINE